jgi:hypothetical protein
VGLSLPSDAQPSISDGDKGVNEIKEKGNQIIKPSNIDERELFSHAPTTLGIFIEADLSKKSRPDYKKIREFREKHGLPPSTKAVRNSEIVDTTQRDNKNMNDSDATLSGELFIPLYLLKSIALYFNQRSVLAIINRALSPIGYHKQPNPDVNPLEDKEEADNILEVYPCMPDALTQEELNLVLSMVITFIDIKYNIDTDTITTELKT